MHYPSGTTVQYAYAADGKTDSLNINGTSLLNQIKYQADGQIGQWKWGNTRVATRSFDIDGRLIAFSKVGSTATIAYDNADRIISMADSSSPSRTQSFAYDNNDALTNYTTNATTQSYQYDEDGNRTAQGNGGAIANYAYASGSNRLLKLTGSQKATLQYDATGNIVTDGTNRYAYDTLGRLVQVSNAAGSTRYLFDPLGQRVAKLSGSGKDGEDYGRNNEDGKRDGNEDSKTATTYFTYDTAGHLIGEYNRQRSQSTEYVWLGNAPVAVLNKNGNAPTKLYYVHTDHLGTPRQVTNSATNAVVWKWFGEPFGTSVPDEDPGHTGKKFTLNLRYAGQYYDKESSLFHNGFRDYNPKTGRYVQSDPIGLNGGLNTYTYVGGNPLSFTDPTGECPWCVALVLTQIGVTATGLYQMTDMTPNYCTTSPDLFPQSCKKHDQCYYNTDTCKPEKSRSQCDSDFGKNIRGEHPEYPAAIPKFYEWAVRRYGEPHYGVP